MSETPRPTSETGTIPAEYIVAAGTGRRVDYVRPDTPAEPSRSSSALGDLRALPEAVLNQFDHTPVLLERAGEEAPVGSIDLERGLTLHAGS